MTGPIEEGRGTIEADVRDDVNVEDVWVVILPPSYVPPASSDELVSIEDTNLPAPIRLRESADGMYRATYENFNEVGTYHLIVYAEDLSGLRAKPKNLLVENGSIVYLPMLAR